MSGFLCEIFRGFGPVIPQDARERTVRQEFVAGLTGRAIVFLVGRIAVALILRAETRVVFFLSAVDSHAFAKCGYLLGKSFTRLFTQTFNPMCEGLACRVVQ